MLCFRTPMTRTCFFHVGHNEVARPCCCDGKGNSRMVFALSVAFAGPLIEPAGEDSGGFHLRGVSSTGKSTA